VRRTSCHGTFSRVGMTWRAERTRSTNLLAVTGHNIFALRPMDKGRCFCVETMQTVGMLVDERVILWHELPSDLRRIGSSSHVGVWCHRHDSKRSSRYESSILSIDTKIIDVRGGVFGGGGVRIRVVVRVRVEDEVKSVAEVGFVEFAVPPASCTWSFTLPTIIGPCLIATTSVSPQESFLPNPGKEDKIFYSICSSILYVEAYQP
jgi:hypothetical protein